MLKLHHRAVFKSLTNQKKRANLCVCLIVPSLPLKKKKKKVSKFVFVLVLVAAVALLSVEADLRIPIRRHTARSRPEMLRRLIHLTELSQIDSFDLCSHFVVLFHIAYLSYIFVHGHHFKRKNFIFFTIIIQHTCYTYAHTSFDIQYEHILQFSCPQFAVIPTHC